MVLGAMTRQPDASIVLTCYQGRDWIGQTIESVLSQSHSNLELIIVNDASPDDAATILESYRLKDPRVKVITNPRNLGIAASCNAGLEQVKGRYFCILDQDDLWRPQKAALQVEYLDSHPDVDAVYSSVELIDANGQSLGERKLPDPKTGDLFVQFFKQEAVPIVSCMFRSTLLERIGTFAIIEGNEDLDYLLRVANATDFGFVPEILVALRCRPGSFSDRDTMVFDQFRLADLLETRWPQHPGLVRRYRSRAHYNTAHYLARTDRLEKARTHFLHSALCRPLFFRAWFWWATAHLPRVVRECLPRQLSLLPEKYGYGPNVLK